VPRAEFLYPNPAGVSDCQAPDRAEVLREEKKKEGEASEEADAGEDTSLDDELKDVDEQLRKLLPLYDKQVGTINFGSRGMTTERNDFLEGTSGSEIEGAPTSGD
jgi:hypothetical protein